MATVTFEIPDELHGRVVVAVKDCQAAVKDETDSDAIVRCLVEHLRGVVIRYETKNGTNDAHDAVVSKFRVDFKDFA